MIRKGLAYLTRIYYLSCKSFALIRGMVLVVFFWGGQQSETLIWMCGKLTRDMKTVLKIALFPVRMKRTMR